MSLSIRTRRADKKRRYWDAKQDNMLRAIYSDLDNETIGKRVGRSWSGIQQRAIKLGLRKSAAFMVSSICRFQKGAKAWNAGLHYTPGGRCRDGWFKKGNYSKRWDRETYCIGALRINGDGGLDIKLREGLRGWDSLARYVWTTERGPIPKGGVIRPINGDPHDTRIENLRLGTRADLMRENTYHNYPKEIARLIQLRGALNRQINRRTNGEQHRRPA